MPDASDILDRAREIEAVAAAFDQAFYLAAYPDVAECGVDPMRHYVEFGHAEGRDPCAWFSTRSYLDDHPDVAAAAVNGFAHFLLIGRKEGRRIWPSPLGSDPVRPPLLEWQVDRVQADLMRGWIWAPRTPSYRVHVILIADGRERAMWEAREYREDLTAKGKGDGCYGFTAPIRSAEIDQGIEIDLVAAAFGISLLNRTSPLRWLS